MATNEKTITAQPKFEHNFGQPGARIPRLPTLDLYDRVLSRAQLGALYTKRFALR